jgi:hypothetical protein
LCTGNGGSGTAWIIAGILKLRGLRKGIDKGSFRLCLENEEAKQMLLGCLKIRK